jgi:hypothetical protein
MPAHHIEGNESSFLQLLTPIVLDGGCGARSYLRKISDNRMPMLQDQIADVATGNGLPVSDVIADDYARLKSALPEHDVLMPTPTVFHLSMHDEPIENFLDREQRSSTGQIGKSLGVAVRMEMLPTPVASEGAKAPAQQDAETKSKTGQVWLSNVAKSVSNANDVDLIGTPRATASESSASQVAAGATKGRIQDQVLTTNWGKFEPAIRRWEAVTRPAPAPTKPDGKDGNHRLSSLFTEWMMGLPDGWVTGHGLKRNDELKMCGNGVVPQQAVLALRYLLQDVELEKATSDS